jgi:DNA-binding response OmpR family regulator
MAVLERIRRRGLSVPVVVLTASALPSVKERAARAGAAMTLRKPASSAELVEAIAQILVVPSRAPTSDPQMEFEALRAEARDTIYAMATEIVEHASSMDTTALRIKAHRLAGLAAQFYATEIADTADRLEAAVTSGGSLDPVLASMAIALSRFRGGNAFGS